MVSLLSILEIESTNIGKVCFFNKGKLIFLSSFVICFIGPLVMNWPIKANFY